MIILTIVLCLMFFFNAGIFIGLLDRTKTGFDFIIGFVIMGLSFWVGANIIHWLVITKDILS